MTSTDYFLNDAYRFNFPKNPIVLVPLQYLHLRFSVPELFGFSRSAAWIFFSTSTLLFAPLLFEIERVQVQTAQQIQQKQVQFSAIL